MPHVVIIGGGISGLAAAYRLQTEAAGRLSWQLIEASPRFGGKIVTKRADGFVIEGGPDSVIAQKPWALELMRELGLSDRLLPSNDESGGTWVLHGGQRSLVPAGLQLLSPESWRDFFNSPLMTWRAKLRFALERWVPRRRDENDESVAKFVRRRFGAGALWSLAEPLLAHVHAADIERMSLQATYPRLADLETRFGSVHRGVAALRAKQRASGQAKTPVFWTLKGGLTELVEALVERLDSASLTAGVRAVSLRRMEDDWAVRLDDGREITARVVLLATPSTVAADLLGQFEASLVERLRTFRQASMATLSLAYRVSDIPPAPRGFGFFVPRQERSAVLAGSWTSTKFDHRAPSGFVLLRIFLGGDGGDGGQSVLQLDDEAVVAAVLEDLETLLGLTSQPILTRLTRWPRGYPQYDVGHRSRVQDLEAALPPGLLVAGSAYHGVGLPDCIRSGTEAARRILEYVQAG